MKTLILGTALAVAASGPASAISLTDFTGFFAFGDSLSDIGNYGPDALPPPYYTNPELGDEFSNGKVWTDLIEDSFNDGFGDDGPGPIDARVYAYGGARASATDAPPSFGPDLDQQVALYLADIDPSVADPFPGTPVPGTNALATVWIGANDIGAIGASLAAEVGAGTDLDTAIANAGASLLAVSNSILASVSTLVERSEIGTVLLLNLPDIGQTPQALDGGPLASGIATILSSGLNDLVGLGLAAGGDSFAKVTTFDVAQLFRTAAENPAAFGLSNVTEPCFTRDGQGSFSVCDNPNDYLFWDGAHPTAAVHAELYAQIFGAPPQVIPLPAGLPLLLAGLGALGLLRRRG